MKRSIAILLAVLLLTVCAPVFASAADDKLPFELVAPAYVSAHWEEENDSPTTTSLTFSLSNDMTAFFKNMSEASLNGTSEQFMAEVGCDDIWMV
ncbi:MAG: hypothetical protein ILO68_03730, partial [Clostridia bacterium]|nr:hypothetical protein [Clostridia bacterium]